MADPFVQEQFSAQIAAAQSLSAQVDIGGWTLVGIVVPANWTTASISFQASSDGGTTWNELVDQTATAVNVSSIVGGASRDIAVDPTKLLGVCSLKVRSGTSGSPVNQTNAVTVQLLTRAVF